MNKLIHFILFQFLIRPAFERLLLRRIVYKTF